MIDGEVTSSREVNFWSHGIDSFNGSWTNTIVGCDNKGVVALHVEASRGGIVIPRNCGSFNIVVAIYYSGLSRSDRFDAFIDACLFGTLTNTARVASANLETI